MTEKHIHWELSGTIIAAARATYDEVDLSKNKEAFVNLLARKLQAGTGQRPRKGYNVNVGPKGKGRRVGTIDLLVAGTIAVWVLRKKAPSEYDIAQFRRVIRAAALDLGLVIMFQPWGITSRRVYPALQRDRGDEPCA